MKNTLKKAPIQLVLFSDRPRRRKPKHLPSPVVKDRKSSRVPHETRPEAKGLMHVVIRIRRGLPNLRTPRALRRLERALRIGKERDGFRLLHYSIQGDHIHLLVDVTNRRKLSKGMHALGIRIAKVLNSLWGRKKGHVFAERYFALAVQGWKQIWRTIRYILNNGRKHGTWTVKGRPDPYSSGQWYVPWRLHHICRALRSPPVVEKLHFGATWIPDVGIDDVPGSRWQEVVEGDTSCWIATY